MLKVFRIVFVLLFLDMSFSSYSYAAIAIVGTPTTTSTAGGSTLTLTYPTGHASGNVAVVFMMGDTGKTVTGAKTYTTKVTITATGTAYAGYLLRRVLDGTEGATEVFTFSSGTVYDGTMRLYSGVNTTTPEDTAGANPLTGTANNSAASVAGFNTVQTNDMLVYFANCPNSFPTLGTPTGFGNAITNVDSTNGDSIGGFDKAQAASGATNTVSSALGASCTWSSALIALQPASIAITHSGFIFSP